MGDGCFASRYIGFARASRRAPKLKSMKFISAASTTLQILATALLGLMAGFFLAFSVEVVPKMLGLDAQGYLGARQAADSQLHEFPLVIVYFGAMVMPLLAALALWACGRARQAQPWLVIGLVYLIGVFLLSGDAGIPLTDAFAQWDSRTTPVHWARERDQWQRGNLLSCATACVSFAGALAALAWRRAQ